jgi:SsrA-binding protein
MKRKDKQDNINVVCTNRKALHNFQVFETIEAGLVLKGTEVKSLRESRVNLKDSYAIIEDGEVFLCKCHISPYDHGIHNNHSPERRRKLLLNKREIKKLIGKISEKGMVLVPLKIYFKGPFAKLELAVAKTKRIFDKRERLKAKIARKEMRKAKLYR